MSELAAFFKQNKPQRKNEFFAASEDFRDADGNPIKWELRHLTSLELNRLRSECLIIGAKGKQVRFDSDLYNRRLVASAVVFPNLRNAELADSYMGEFAPEDRVPENLICLMLDRDADFQRLLAKVNEMNGLAKTSGDDDEDSRIETAKN